MTPALQSAPQLMLTSAYGTSLPIAYWCATWYFILKPFCNHESLLYLAYRLKGISGGRRAGRPKLLLLDGLSRNCLSEL